MVNCELSIKNKLNPANLSIQFLNLTAMPPGPSLEKRGGVTCLNNKRLILRKPLSPLLFLREGGLGDEFGKTQKIILNA